MSTSNTVPERLPRCCSKHPDWATLAAHLVRDFPGLETRDILAQLQMARQVVDQFGLDPVEGLETGELLTRQQLMLLNGDIPDVARLDPEVHVRAVRQDAPA